MHWKEQVAQLESEGNFDIAVFLLEKVIKENPDEMDAYIFLLYRFADSFLENDCYWANSKDPLNKIKEEYCKEKNWTEYVALAQRYFDESYKKFSDNPEYLYYASCILMPAYWYIGLQIEENLLKEMNRRAIALGYNKYLNERHPNDTNDIDWAKRIMNDLSIKEQLATKGVVGEYVLGAKIAWAKKILAGTGMGTSDSKH